MVIGQHALFQDSPQMLFSNTVFFPFEEYAVYHALPILDRKPHSVFHRK
jgi:hypothetical protein